MSRSGYTDEIEDQWAYICWRGAVSSAINGKRGQQLLRELADAMDAMPEKILIANDLVKEGAYCALGVVGLKRGIALEQIDPYDPEGVAKHFNIASALAKEIVYENDEGDYGETPEQRWNRVRRWVAEQLKAPK